MERIISNARDWSIESNCTYSILVGIANDIGTKDIRCIWCYDAVVVGSVEDLPCWVDVTWVFECTYLTRPVGCLVSCECTTRDVAFRQWSVIEYTISQYRWFGSFYMNCIKFTTISKRTISNTRYAIWNRDRS